MAADAFGNFGLDARSAARKLAETVRSDGNDGWQSAQNLGRVGDVKIAVPVLTQALTDQDKNVRRFAAMGLGHLGASANKASTALKNFYPIVMKGYELLPQKLCG